MGRFDLTGAELASLLEGEPAYRIEQVVDGLWRRGLEPDELTTLPKALRARLADDPRLAPGTTVVADQASDRGATRKLVLEAPDGARVETVVMAYRSRTTVCCSSQAGCAMGCQFCATGQLGFGRHLTAGEIVEQVVRAGRLAESAGFPRLGNVVMMGMGEPLANYDRVLTAVRTMNTDLRIGARSITISTVGIVPGIERLATEPLQVNLAVSLHAADDELRDELVPINRRYPLGRLMVACERYVAKTGRRLSFEWALIDQVNDRPRDAAGLAELANSLRAHVNLIPLNPTPGYLVQGSPPSSVHRFKERLEASGVNVTVRNTRGRRAEAACGQLAAGLAPGSLGRRRRQVAPVTVRA